MHGPRTRRALLRLLWGGGLLGLFACGGFGGGEPPPPESEEEEAPELVDGCDGARLREVPLSPGSTPEILVGARTVQVGRLRTEIWYPSSQASADALEPRVYDIREALHPSERVEVPDALNLWQDCDCYPDLPLDTASGPHPVVIFVHGTASFRTQSLSLMTHLAQRGHIVVAADHPGLFLGDTLAFLCPYEASGGRDLEGDIDVLLQALSDPADDLAFLRGAVDPGRVALMGHSAGAGAIAAAASRAGVVAAVSLAGAEEVAAGPDYGGALFLVGLADEVITPEQSTAAFAASPHPRSFLSIQEAGHLAFSDLCELKNAQGENLLEVGRTVQLCGAELAGFLFDCDATTLDSEPLQSLVRTAVTGFLEPHTRCIEEPASLASEVEDLPGVEEVRTEEAEDSP